jgi:hypothetical protein
MQEKYKAIEGLSYNDACTRYLDLLNGLAADLPFYYDLDNSNKGTPSVDSFIENYAPEYGKDCLALNYEIEVVSKILDAKTARDSAYKSLRKIEEENDYPEGVVNELRKHLLDSQKALQYNLGIVYSGMAVRPRSLESDFFSDDRMPKINEAIRLKTEVIDRRYDNSETAYLGFPSVRFGDLVAEFGQ